jgi:hypothetical protein
MTYRNLTGIARELEKNKINSKYISDIMAREYTPIKIDNASRKEALENNKAFFEKIAKKLFKKIH